MPWQWHGGAHVCVGVRMLAQTWEDILSHPAQLARVLFSFFFKDLFLFCLCLYGTRVKEGIIGTGSGALTTEPSLIPP